MRSGTYLQDAVNWFTGRGIVLYGVQQDPEQSEWTDSPKCYANFYIDDAALGTPLLKLAHFNRQCVDWSKIRQILRNHGILHQTI